MPITGLNKMKRELINNDICGKKKIPNNKYNGKTFVIKYGGAAMTEKKLRDLFAEDIIYLKKKGIRAVIVHGGGNDISSMSKKLNVPVKFVNGLRYTSKDTMEIAKMVLIGKTNKEIISTINKAGGNAVGFSGIDANVFIARKLRKAGEDLGYVGEILKVNTSFIELLLSNGYTPVIAPIGTDDKGRIYNINADDAAATTAVFLKADKLIYVTDVSGVLAEGKTIKRIDMKTAFDLIEKNVINKGMVPKILSAFKSINSGVKKVHIINGTKHHSLLKDIFTDKSRGTEIVVVK